jgi:hypothetical protein
VRAHTEERGRRSTRPESCPDLLQDCAICVMAHVACVACHLLRVLKRVAAVNS